MDEETFDESDWIKDNYEHVVPSVNYCVTSIPGKGFEEYEDDILLGCCCEDNQCLDEKCSCLSFEKNYDRTENGRLILRDEKLCNKPVTECCFNCRCFSKLTKGNSCFNRNVQFGPLTCLEVFQTPLKGFGLKTNRSIMTGSFICEYAGEIIGVSEAKTRLEFNLKNNETNYVFIAKEHFSKGIIKTCIDPKYIGNIGRYINHSCKPNCAIVPVRIHRLVPKLCVFAISHINAGDEITYDYSGQYLYSKINDNVCRLENTKEAVAEARLGLTICYCEESICKKYLPFDDEI